MQNFGKENFDDSTCIRQICQTFPPSKFYAIWYYTLYKHRDICNLLEHKPAVYV